MSLFVTRTLLILVGSALAFGTTVFSAGNPLPVGEERVAVRFLDSATGAAIRPEKLLIRPQLHPHAQAELNRNDVSSNGRSELLLSRSRHTLTAMAPGYAAVSGDFEPPAENSYTIRFLLDPEVEPVETRPEHVAELRREGFMLVQGFVTDDDSGQLLAGAQVTANPGGAQTTTDARGFFRLYVPAPAEVDSEEVASTLVVEKPGFKRHIRHSLELWSGGDCTYRLRLTRGGGTEVVDERTTRRRAPTRPPSAQSLPPDAQALPEDSALKQADVPVPQPATLPANATVRVPRNIRVLNGDGTTIDYVSMTYYNRAVLGSEWIASWGSIAGGTNSLSAGAVAVRCYAIYKLNAVSPTSNYDICGTTSCQVYNPAKIHALTDAAVNYTLDWVLLSGTNIANTEYSAENNSLDLEGVDTFSCANGFTAPTGGCLYDPICGGQDRYGHGRGMCQWGTARWATARKMNGRVSGDATPSGYPRRDWKWIVQHYYPTLLFVKGAPLVTGDDVKAMRTLEVRECPGGTITNGTACALLATKSASATGVILEGPVVVTQDGKGFSWYRVQWSDGVTGWSVENYLERIFSIPAAPLNLVATSTSTSQINLTWTDPANVEAGFVLERGPSASGPWIAIATLNASTTTFVDADLLAANTWHYRLKAYNAGGSSAYSATASATTRGNPPVISALQNQTVIEETALSLSPAATVSDRWVQISDFDAFMTETANGVVLFKDPRLSGSTSAYLESQPNVAAVTDTFPAGNGTGMVLRVQFAFNSTPDPWLRLTTAGVAAWSNPVIDLTKKLQFKIYADRSISLGLGCRETSTAVGTPIGSNGGQTGGIEWVGVTNVSGAAPMPGRVIPAGSWTTVVFDLPNEAVRNFSSGNGALSTASGLGVLEHLAIVPNAGTGTYNVYLDDFVVVSPRSLTWSLGPGAPSGAAIDPNTGLISWIPAENQGPAAYSVSVVVADNSVPALRATNTFTINVGESNSAPALTIPVSSLTLHAGANITFTNSATDLDWPTNALTYSLAPGAPTGAEIDSLSGRFRWVTTDLDAHSTNTIVVRVSDNGTPVLEDAKSFTVAVLPRPMLFVRPVSAEDRMLSWNAVPGTTYTVEYKDNLADQTWLKLMDVTATSPVVAITNAPGMNSRFYRMMIVP